MQKILFIFLRVRILKERMKNPVRPSHSSFWQFCRVANARGYGWHLANHPKPRRAGSRNIFQRFLWLASVASMPVILAGCLPIVSHMHVDFIYIYNKLTIPISFCRGYESETCPRIIDPGSMDGDGYMSQGGDPGEEHIYQIFDRIEITICGEPINFKRIREISPVTKHWRPGSHQYEIVIDKTVKDAFCQKDLQND